MQIDLPAPLQLMRAIRYRFLLQTFRFQLYEWRIKARDPPILYTGHKFGVCRGSGNLFFDCPAR